MAHTTKTDKGLHAFLDSLIAEVEADEPDAKVRLKLGIAKEGRSLLAHTLAANKFAKASSRKVPSK